jgi:hypothetical protein
MQKFDLSFQRIHKKLIYKHRNIHHFTMKEIVERLGKADNVLSLRNECENLRSFREKVLMITGFSHRDVIFNFCCAMIGS